MEMIENSALTNATQPSSSQFGPSSHSYINSIILSSHQHNKSYNQPSKSSSAQEANGDLVLESYFSLSVGKDSYKDA